MPDGAGMARQARWLDGTARVNPFGICKRHNGPTESSDAAHQREACCRGCLCYAMLENVQTKHCLVSFSFGNGLP